MSLFLRWVLNKCNPWIFDSIRQRVVISQVDENQEYDSETNRFSKFNFQTKIVWLIHPINSLVYQEKNFFDFSRKWLFLKPNKIKKKQEVPLVDQTQVNLHTEHVINFFIILQTTRRKKTHSLQLFQLHLPAPLSTIASSKTTHRVQTTKLH